MAFDAIFLSAVVAELNAALADARIDKIQQPTRDAVLLTLRGRQGTQRLLLSASGGGPRLHLTQERIEQPAQPPMFCMLLRKHLQGGRLEGLTQPPRERAVDLCFSCRNELGDLVQKHLWLELMGRNANLILTDESGRIVDCLRRVDLEQSEKRQVLPGLYYRLPPAQEKRDPLTVPEETLAALLRQRTGTPGDRFLTDAFLGLSPLVARELTLDLTGSTDGPVSERMAAALCARLHALGQDGEPWLLLEGDKPKDYSFLPIRQYGSRLTPVRCETFSALLDRFYGQRDREQRIRSRSQSLRKTVTNLHARLTRKLEAQTRELAATRDRETLRRKGDLVTANLYRIERGAARVTVEDFYDPDLRQLTVDLDPALSPQQNAARFYKQYAKAKNAEKVLQEQLRLGSAERDYLASVLEELDRAETEADLAEIRAELTEQGYVRDQSRGKKMKEPPARPMEFTSADGDPIYVGRNNRQNDRLTCKAAEKGDLWFHAQKIHGSHVILACGGRTPSERALTQAAGLAAFYSQARGGGKVPVDYCPVRQVKKPAGAKPGMVVYENYRTIYVEPSAFGLGPSAIDN